MFRRTFLKMAMAGGAMAALPASGRVLAQDASPVPDGVDAGLLLVRWELQSIQAGDGTTTTPDKPANYAIQFLPDGKLAIQADCNRAFGPYTAEGANLTMGPLASTKAMCPEGSIADVYLLGLEQAASFTRVPDASDVLTVTLKDGGTMTFAPSPLGVVWQWTGFQGGDGSTVTANDPSRYSVEFLTDGSVLVQADCNHGRGDNAGAGSQIDLTIAITLMACADDSQDSLFLSYLDQATSWVIRDGKLWLALPMDTGIASFQAVLPMEDDGTPEAGG